MINLRPYQQTLIDRIRYSLANGNHSVCAVLGCGGGKSVIAAAIALSTTERHNRLLFLVHRKELCGQIRQTFERFGVYMDLCDIAMVQTATRRLGSMPDYQLIITDECQHCTAASYRRIYNHYPEALHIGFTATPVRLNRGGLGEVYSDLIESVSTKWLIDHRYLAPYRYYSAPLADTSGLHIRGGEYRQDEVAQLMESGTIYGDTVKQWERLAKGKKTIVYCASVEAAERTAVEFINHGYNATALCGATPKAQREQVMSDFRADRLTVLCNCELFGEGLDVPDCECVVLLRPTQSLTLFIQQSMRSMRYMPGKTAIIIDHVGNCYRHGLPDDDREWSLEPKEKQEESVKIRVCKNCYSVYPPTLDHCPFCGYKAEHEVRCKDGKIVDVDLVEVKRQEELKHTKMSDVRLYCWEQIREYQTARKLKFAWCLHYAISKGIPYPKKYIYQAKKISSGPFWTAGKGNSMWHSVKTEMPDSGVAVLTWANDISFEDFVLDSFDYKTWNSEWRYFDDVEYWMEIPEDFHWLPGMKPRGILADKHGKDVNIGDIVNLTERENEPSELAVIEEGYDGRMAAHIAGTNAWLYPEEELKVNPATGISDQIEIIGNTMDDPELIADYDEEHIAWDYEDSDMTSKEIFTDLGYQRSYPGCWIKYFPRESNVNSEMILIGKNQKAAEKIRYLKNPAKAQKWIITEAEEIAIKRYAHESGYGSLKIPRRRKGIDL